MEYDTSWIIVREHRRAIKCWIIVREHRRAIKCTIKRQNTKWRRGKKTQNNRMWPQTLAKGKELSFPLTHPSWNLAKVVVKRQSFNQMFCFCVVYPDSASNTRKYLSGWTQCRFMKWYKLFRCLTSSKLTQVRLREINFILVILLPKTFTNYLAFKSIDFGRSDKCYSTFVSTPKVNTCYPSSPWPEILLMLALNTNQPTLLNITQKPIILLMKL
jgi:hypothetical protein